MDIVIRAGGAGTRLWPWSRQGAPKQFQRLFGKQAMLAETVRRVSAVADKKHLWISVNSSLAEKAHSLVPDLAVDHFIIEPEARNTGAAVCLEICFLEKRISPQTIVASLPSDDYISDEGAFLKLLQASEVFIMSHPEYIVAPAVMPDYPEVGYSYLKTGSRLNEDGEEAMFAVADFIEKPNLEYCKSLIADGLHYWHTGMYVWRLGRIIELFEEYQPQMIETCRRIVAFPVGDSKAVELFASIEKMSIEAAITHRVATIAMSVSNRVGWSDVGKWPAVKRLSDKDQAGNVVEGEVLLHDSKENIVYNGTKEKLVVLNNVSNLAVIETDDVLIVSDLASTEEVRKIIKRLEEEKKDKYL